MKTNILESLMPASTADNNHDVEMPLDKSVPSFSIQEFGNGWAMSRAWWRCYYATPILVCCGLAGVAVWYATALPGDMIAKRYKSALNQLASPADDELAELYLNRLIQIDPSREHYFELALNYERQRKLERTRGIMQRLAPVDGIGFAPAHLWLAKQLSKSMKSGPSRKLRPAYLHHLTKAAQLLQGDRDANAFIGRAFFDLNLFEEARPCLVCAVNKYPRMGIQLAKVCMKLHDFEQATKHVLLATGHLESELQRHPDDTEIRVELAEAYALGNRWLDAEKLLFEQMQQDGQAQPEYGLALSRLYLTYADVLATKNAKPSAQRMQVLVRALALDPTSTDLLRSFYPFVFKFHHLLNSQTLALIKNCGTQDLQATPETASRIELTKTVAFLNTLEGDHQTAIRLLTSLEIHDDETSFLLAKCMQQNGDPTAADTRYRELLQRIDAAEGLTRQKDVARAVLRIRCLIALRDWKQADSAFQHLATASPGHASLAKIAEELYFGWSQASQDLPHIQRFTRMLPVLNYSNSIEVRNRINQTIAGSNIDNDQAIAVLKRLLAQGKSTQLLHELLGNIAAQDGNYQVARTHLEAAISGGRIAPATLNNLAWVLIHDQHPDLPQALTLIKKAMAVEGNRPRYLETRAAVYLAQDLPKAAIRDLERALPHSQSATNIHKLLARAYRQIGDSQLADLHDELATEASALSSAEQGDDIPSSAIDHGREPAPSQD